MRFAIPAIAFGAALVGGLSALTLNAYVQQRAEQSRISRVESLLSLHRQNYQQNLALETERDADQCDALVRERDFTKDELEQIYERHENVRQELREFLVANGYSHDEDFLIGHGLAPDPRYLLFRQDRSEIGQTFRVPIGVIESLRNEIRARLTPCSHNSDYIS